MRNHRLLAILVAVLALFLAIRFIGPWEAMVKRWQLSRPPAPYRFESLKHLSDEEIAAFMSGTPEPDSRHPADAPDSHFPQTLWNTAPKAAALAFAEANRTPEHRKHYSLFIDPSSTLKAPDAGWLVFDPGSASCPLSSSGTFSQTVLRFGVDQPFLFYSAIHTSGPWSNPLVDRTGHSLQFIPLTPDEARFIAHTLFWLEHILSKDVLSKKSGLWVTNVVSSSSISSTADGYGRIDWLIGKLPPRRVTETIWATSSIAARWGGEYDAEAGMNLASHLLDVALPKYLGKRRPAEAQPSRAFRERTIKERLNDREDPAELENLSRVILSALASHETDPWPVAAVVSLVECAGDSGLAATLPALEHLMSELPAPSADESEFTTLDEQFRFVYPEPKDPAERVKWERHRSLETSLEHDFPTQVRRPLARAIRQLHAIGKVDQLREMARVKDESSGWAFRRLYQLQPDEYSEALIARFKSATPWDRQLIFNTLAELDPAATRRLRDSLTADEQNGLFFEITRFEVADDPQRARLRIPALFDLAEKTEESKSSDEKYPTRPLRGAAIELLAMISLDAGERQRFERLLLKELLSPGHLELYGNYAISEAAAACMTFPDPERFWDALYQAAWVETGTSEFTALFDALARLAAAKPEPHLAQLADVLRPRINRHRGYMDRWCMAALAMDLRSLAPDIRHFATSGPTVPEDKNSSDCKDEPCRHRYHAARHVCALWLEADADTRARMWTVLLIASPYDFTGNQAVPSALRDRCQSAIAAATPAIRSRLIAKLRSHPEWPDEFSEWMNALTHTQQTDEGNPR